MSGLSAAPRGAPPESSPPAPGGLAPDRAAATGAGHAGAFGRFRPALFRAAACLVVAAAALLALPGGASAQENPVRPSWSLTPSGLSDGDKFRLIFVTSTTLDATSSDIERLQHLRAEPRGGGAHRPSGAYSSQFRVVGSTATVDARDNTNTTGTGVPIYWLNGNKVADHYADFYNGNWERRGEPEGANRGNGFTVSTPRTSSNIHTGSNNNGTRSSDNNDIGTTPLWVMDVSTTRGREVLTILSVMGAQYGVWKQYVSLLRPVAGVHGQGSAPAITDVSVTSRPADGTDTFGGGERVEVTVTFDRGGEGAKCAGSTAPM